MFTQWTPDGPPSFAELVAPTFPEPPVLPVIGGVLAVLYLVGVVRLAVLRRRWPLGRTVCFVLGCALLIAVGGLGLEAYGTVMLSVFMFQQLTIMMTIPPLLVLGAPGSLLLRATPHRGAGRMVLRLALAGLRSRRLGWLLSPAVGIPLFLLSFFGLYLGGLIDPVLAMPGGHLLLEVVFLAVGVLFTIPLLTIDPVPVRIGHATRAVDVFVEAGLHAFFGIVLMMGTYTIVDTFASASAEAGIDPLFDQQVAGGLAWGYGEAPTVIILLVIMYRWFRDDTRRAAAADVRADRDGDAELEAYNARLAAMSARSRRQEASSATGEAAADDGERRVAPEEPASTTLPA
ncbi:MAG: hypothetical protein DI534_06870 [Leifsonia xyli]|nr:MAG: hypothetical protein DI534_06870 [Leifsonia xyli]